MRSTSTVVQARVRLVLVLAALIAAVGLVALVGAEPAEAAFPG